jgi:FkbM family methyltransferase
MSWGRIKTEFVTYPWFGERIISPRSWIHFLDDNWENESLNHLVQNIEQGDVFVDVGACFGLYTVIASKLVKRDGFVYAFEPDPYMFRLLKANIEMLRLENIIACNFALGESNRVSKFYVTNGGMSSLQPMTGLRSVINTSVKTLDHFHIKKIDWMKIDTEGTEHLVLEGAKETLERCKPKLLIEFLPQFGNTDKLLQALEGWKITGLDNNILCEKEND